MCDAARLLVRLRDVAIYTERVLIKLSAKFTSAPPDIKPNSPG